MPAILEEAPPTATIPAAPEPAPAAPAPAPSAALTPSEIEAGKKGLERFSRRMNKEHLKEPPPAPVVAAPVVAEPEPPKPATPEPPKPPKKRKEAVPAEPVAAPVPSLTADEIAEAAARGTATAMQKQKPAPAPEPVEELSSSEQRKVRVFEKMGELDPEAKGLKEKYVASLKRQTAYEQQWIKENPGTEFDPNDTQHNDFFDRNEVKYDQDSYIDAAADLRAEHATKKYRDEVDSLKAEREREKQARELEPELVKEQRRAGSEFFKALGDDDFKPDEIIGKDLQLNHGAVTKLQESNKKKADIFFQAAAGTEAVARAAYTVLNGITPFDDKDPAHVTLDRAVADIQTTFADKRDDKGREFKPWLEYHKLSAKDKARHWTVTAQQVANIVAEVNARSAKTFYDNMVKETEEMAESLGYTKNGSSNGTKQKAASEAVTHTPATVKPVSPAATSTPISTVEGGAPAGTKLSGVNRFLARVAGVR